MLIIPVIFKYYLQANMTLLERVGGKQALSAVVDKFYEFMLADPIVSHFFKNTDMTKQRAQQKAFLGMVCFY